MINTVVNAVPEHFGAEAGCARQMRGGVCLSWCLGAAKVALYLVFSFNAYLGCWWTAFNPALTTCAHPPLPVNQSGLQVLVAGFAKTGTRTLSRTLYQIGYERSYHGEDFLQFVWHPHFKEHWAKPENGGHRLAPIGLPWKPTDTGKVLLEATPPEKLAELLSRCRVDALALDGIEHLFWHVYRVSPGVKVIVLNWRTFEEARKSFEQFAAVFVPWQVASTCLSSACGVLPWNVVFSVIEPLIGNPLLEYQRQGAPPSQQVMNPYVVMWSKACAFLVGGHWWTGLSAWPRMTKEAHAAFFKTVKWIVPPGDRMDFDPRKHTYEDLCRFLGMSECRRSGRIPRARNVFNTEIDFLPTTLITTPMLVYMHWVNYRVIKWILGLVWRALTAALRLCCRRCSRSRSKAE